MTYNEGHNFMVKEALHLDANYLKLIDPILKHLYAHSHDPRDWAEKESLDVLKIEDV